ncbi:hypothetical protein BKA69DRAFT_1041953 [Paraphysoderma sedebokerense]|nr:hypothetical protein BKA69DRAFT_1041953 [Paraphysoderma sedebokerense]
MALVALECYVVWKRKWYKTPLLIGGFLFVLVVTLNTVYLAISPVSRTKEGTCTVGYKKEVGAAFNIFTLLYYVYIYVVTAYKLTAHLTGGGARNQPNNRNFVSTARSVLTVPTSTSGTRSIQSETGQLDASSKLYVLLTCNHRFALAIALVAVFKVINTYFITPAISLASHQFVSEVTKPQRKRSRSNSSSSSRSDQSDRSNMSHATINTNQTSSTLQTQSQSRDHAVIKINKPSKNKTPDVNSYSRSPRTAFVGSQNSGTLDVSSYSRSPRSALAGSLNSGTLDVNSYNRSPHSALSGSLNSATADIHSYSRSPHTTVAGSAQYNFI